MSPIQPRPYRRAAGVALALGAAAALTVTGGPAGAESLTLSAATSFTVQYRGNGHGHGMSQYGARGAAIAGKNYKQILAFYYPGATLAAAKNRLIRVKLSRAGSTTTIAAASATTVTGVSGYLATKGISRYRLVAGAGTTVTLQRLAAGPRATWTNVRTGLPSGAEFYRHDGHPSRLFLSDGTSSDYNGYLRAVRQGASRVMTIDRVGLEWYTAGVVPREMPASWQRAAVDAQAVAARTYGSNAMTNGQHDYDICDTSMCQVYGGVAHYSRSGALLYSQFPPAAKDTANQILLYRGAPIFAQFSASNGGWTVYGGYPYLPAKADPYDTPRSGDPYINASLRVPVSVVARHFKLAKVKTLAITKRDAHGTWGGRVLAGTVSGTDAQGHAKSYALTGFDFQDLFGLGTTWFQVLAAR